MIAAGLAIVHRIARVLPARRWLILAVAVTALALALWIYNAGGDAVREDVAADAAKAEAKAAPNREKAATERTLDTVAVTKRLEEWNHAAEQTPDAAPDDRELRRRCRQLWDAGRRDIPACRGLAGAAQAGPR